MDPDAKECRQLLEVREGKGINCFLEPPKEHNPAEILMVAH
jgi:hypothetical protein